MATLEELWSDKWDETSKATVCSRHDITKVVRRSGKKGIYLSLAHDTFRKAFDAAMVKQKGIDHEDFMADDWYVE